MAKDKAGAVGSGSAPASESATRAAKVGDRVLLHYMRSPGPTKTTADGKIVGVDKDGLCTVEYTPRGRDVAVTMERVPYGPTGAFGFVFDGD